MKQTLAIKLVPTPDQHAALVATLERFNAACDAIAVIAYRERCANKLKLQKLVYYQVRADFRLSAQMTVRAISKVVEAYKRDRRIQPRFRPHGAMTYDERILSWKGIEHVSLLSLEGRLLIPILFGPYQAARLDRRQGQADLVYRDGVFYLYVTIDTPLPPPGECVEFLGVDLGIVNLAVDSDGTTYSGAAVDDNRRRFAHRRRNLQRKGTKAARRKLRAIRSTQSRFQRDTNHIISKRVVATAKDTTRGIAVEDLDGIRGRVTVRHRQRARHANWGFAQLQQFVAYKAALAGVPVVAVDPRNTSRTCPVCGCIDKANRPTQARFSCVSCGFSAAADHVAARNIAFRARAVVNQPMVSHLSAPLADPGTSSRL